MATAQATVEYRDVPGFPGYRVGSDGSVWSRRKPGFPTKNTTSEWRRLCPCRMPTGYRVLMLSGPKKKLGRFLLHRLVLALFVGPCPPKMEGCHNDGNPDNNAVTNLRWDTHAANSRDRIRHGAATRGDHNGQAKLTWEAVAAIRAEYAAGGVAYATLARRHGVCAAVIGDVVRGVSWQNYPDGIKHKAVRPPAQVEELPDPHSRDIPRHPGYRIGDDGRIWSKRSGRWRRIKPTTDGAGYQIVNLRLEGVGQRTRTVHVLMLEAFVGPRPHGALGCHGDGNRGNNQLGNLRWDTGEGNCADQFKHGTKAQAKLTPETVRRVREEYAAGRASQQELADAYGVCQPTISAIILRRTWSHVQ